MCVNLSHNPHLHAITACPALQAIEKLIELLANEAEPLGEALAGRGEAAEPEAAASAAAEAGSGAAESKPAAAAQQGASPPPEQPAAATALQPAASSSGHGEGSCVGLLLQPANGSWEQVAVQLRLVGGASQGAAREADAAAEPGPSSNAAAAHADGESSGSEGAGSEGSGGRRQAAGEGSKGASSGHGRKGVRLKGKGGQAGREGKGKGPPRNKPCPCGSKQKYKNVSGLCWGLHGLCGQCCSMWRLFGTARLHLGCAQSSAAEAQC